MPPGKKSKKAPTKVKHAAQSNPQVTACTKAAVMPLCVLHTPANLTVPLLCTHVTCLFVLQTHGNNTSPLSSSIPAREVWEALSPTQQQEFVSIKLTDVAQFGNAMLKQGEDCLQLHCRVLQLP